MLVFALWLMWSLFLRQVIDDLKRDWPKMRDGIAEGAKEFAALPIEMKLLIGFMLCVGILTYVLLWRKDRKLVGSARAWLKAAGLSLGAIAGGFLGVIGGALLSNRLPDLGVAIAVIGFGVLLGGMARSFDIVRRLSPFPSPRDRERPPDHS
jgi:hypothetical protein